MMSGELSYEKSKTEAFGTVNRVVWERRRRSGTGLPGESTMGRFVN